MPFGGLTTILVGDFDQKKPCKKGSSLAQILVNYTTEDVQSTERARIAGIFAQFRKFELTGSERIKNKDDDLHKILHHIKMNDQPIILELLEKLPKLKRLDEMTNTEGKVAVLSGYVHIERNTKQTQRNKDPTLRKVPQSSDIDVA